MNLELEEAVRAYREAGFYWEASEIKLPHTSQNGADVSALITETLSAPCWTDVPLEALHKALIAHKWKKFEELIAPFSSTLERLRLVGDEDRFVWERDWDLGFIEGYGDLFRIKDLVKLICIRARAFALRDDWDESIKDLIAARRVCRLLDCIPTSISALLQVIYDSIVLAYIERLSTLAFGNLKALELLNSVGRPEPVTSDLVPLIKLEAYIQLASLRNYNPDYYHRMVECEDIDDVLPTRVDPDRLFTTGLPESPESQEILLKVLKANTMLAHHFGEIREDQQRVNEIESKIVEEVWPNATENEEDVSILYFHTSRLIVERIRNHLARQIVQFALIEVLIFQVKESVFPARAEDLPTRWIDPFTVGSISFEQGAGHFQVYCFEKQENVDLANRSELQAPEYVAANFPTTFE